MFTLGDNYGYYYPFTKIDSDIEFTFSANEGAKNQLAHYAGTPGSKNWRRCGVVSPCNRESKFMY